MHKFNILISLSVLMFANSVMASGKGGKIPDDEGKSKLVSHRTLLSVQQQEEDKNERAYQFAYNLFWEEKTKDEGARHLRNLAEDIANPRSLDAAIQLLFHGDEYQQILAKKIMLDPNHPQYINLYQRAFDFSFSDSGSVLYALIASDERHPDHYPAALQAFRMSQCKSEDKRKIAPFLIKVAHDTHHKDSGTCALIVFCYGDTDERRAVLDVVKKIAKDQSHPELGSVVLGVFLTGNVEDKTEARKIIEEAMSDIKSKDGKYYATTLLEKGNRELKRECVQFLDSFIKRTEFAKDPIDCMALNLFLRFADPQDIEARRDALFGCINSLCIVKEGEVDRIGRIWSLIDPNCIPKDYEDAVVIVLRKIARNEGGNQPVKDSKKAAYHLMRIAQRDFKEFSSEEKSEEEESE